MLFSGWFWNDFQCRWHHSTLTPRPSESLMCGWLIWTIPQTWRELSKVSSTRLWVCSWNHLQVLRIPQVLFTLQRVSVPDRALRSLWVHLWGDAPEGQCPSWKTGWLQSSAACPLSCVNSSISFRTFSIFSPPLRTFVPTQRTGLHWARSRWSEPPPALPVKPPARSRVWSVNRHSSLTLTVSKAWPSKAARSRKSQPTLPFFC